MILSAEKNHFLTSLPSIQEKLVDTLRNVSAPIVQSEVFLCVRVLVCRLSPHNLSSFWPVILTELVSIPSVCCIVKCLLLISSIVSSTGCCPTLLAMGPRIWDSFYRHANCWTYCWCYRPRSSKCESLEATLHRARVDTAIDITATLQSSWTRMKAYEACLSRHGVSPSITSPTPYLLLILTLTGVYTPIVRHCHSRKHTVP